MRVRPRTCSVLLCVALLHGTQSRRVRKKVGEKQQQQPDLQKGAGPAQVPTDGQLPGAGGAAPPGGAGQPGPRPRGVPGALPGIPPPGSQLAPAYLDVRPDGWERGTLREVSAIARTAGWTEDNFYKSECKISAGMCIMFHSHGLTFRGSKSWASCSFDSFNVVQGFANTFLSAFTRGLR